MKTDETFDRFPALEEEWQKQEAARTSRPRQARPALEAPSGDGYARLFHLMIEARDLDPPEGLAFQITSAIEDHANAARQVDTFRRMIRRCMALPIATVIVAGATSIGISDLADALSVTSWLYLPALALLLGVLPVRSKRSA